MGKNKNEKFFLGKRKKRSRFWFWLLIFFLAVLLLIASLYFFIFSSFFKVQAVEINTSEHIDKDILFSAIIAQMTDDYEWRSWLGVESILFWQFGKHPVVKSETLPYFKDLSLEVDLSSKKVIIHAKERKAIGVFCLQEEQCFVFDDEGVLFSKSPNVEGSLILKIKDENQKDIVLGEPILSDSLWVNNLLQTLQIIQASGLKIKEVRIKDKIIQEWEVLTFSGAILIFNLNFMPNNLADIFTNLHKKVDISKINYIDFRVPSRIYYK